MSTFREVKEIPPLLSDLIYLSYLNLLKFTVITLFAYVVVSRRNATRLTPSLTWGSRPGRFSESQNFHTGQSFVTMTFISRGNNKNKMQVLISAHLILWKYKLLSIHETVFYYHIKRLFPRFMLGEFEYSLLFANHFNYYTQLDVRRTII